MDARLITFAGQQFREHGGRGFITGGPEIGWLLDTYVGRGVLVRSTFRPNVRLYWHTLTDENGREFDVSYHDTQSVGIAGKPTSRDERLTLRQAAERSGITENALRVAISRNRLEAETITTPYGERRILIWPDDLDHYIAGRPGGVNRKPRDISD